MNKTLDSYSFQIISIGNELLNGKTINNNLNWLSESITSLGCEVICGYVILDKIDEICNCLEHALSKNSKWIIISGGLGPTYDDITLEAISKFLNRPLSLNRDGMNIIKKNYMRLYRKRLIKDPTIDDYRKKMAMLPRSSIPLSNNVGIAPGVLLNYKNRTIICLPGVPQEMQSIFSTHVTKIIKSKIQPLYVFEGIILISNLVESIIAPLILQMKTKHNQVYIKSHPRGLRNNKPLIEISIIGKNLDHLRSKKNIKHCIADLQELILNSDGKILKSYIIRK